MSSRRWRGDSPETFHQLRSQWRTASLASGWPFPNDWAVAEVDVVCQTALADLDLAPALTRLGRARATAGSGLAETLHDVAALHAVLTMPSMKYGLVSADPDAVPARLLRLTALAWADVLVSQLAHTEVADGLTGLSSPAYLRARLREVYREAAAAGVPARERYVLVVVAPDLRETAGWSRLAAMVLLADVLTGVFDGGQTLTALGSSTIGVLAERSPKLARRTATVRTLAADRLGIDPQLRCVGAPPVWLERLPPTHAGACRLLTALARL
jgi:hypothetical protein